MICFFSKQKAFIYEFFFEKAALFCYLKIDKRSLGLFRGANADNIHVVVIQK